MVLEFDQAAASARVFAAVRRQRDLADFLGVSAQAISHLKQKGRCTLDLVLAASELTGKSTDWFLYGRGGPPDLASEYRTVAAAARASAEQCMNLLGEFRVAEGEPGYAAGLEGRMEILERFYGTFLSWMKFVELHLEELS